MPLPSKTLREVAAEIGLSEAEVRAMIDMGKIRSIFKKGTHYIAPDEIAKIKRQRKTLPDSAIKAPPPPVPPPATIAKPPVKRPPPTSMFGN